MKIPAAFFLSIALLSATPNRNTISYEKIFRSGDDGYLTFLITSDNHGSYYTAQNRHILVKYSKPNESEHKVEQSRQFVLEDMINSVHGPYRLQHKVIQTGEEVSLTQVLAEYPFEPSQWSLDRRKVFTISTDEGIYLGAFCVVDLEAVKTTLGILGIDKFHWSLVSVWEDTNTLYMQLSMGDEEYTSRFLPLSKKKTQQIRDQLARQPEYIVYGHVDSLEAANSNYQLFTQKLRDAKAWRTRMEIWEEQRKSKSLFYLVDADSATKIEKEQVNQNNEILECEAKVVSSEFFIGKFTPINK